MVASPSNNVTGHPLAVYAYTIPISFNADGSETDTTYDLPATGIVVDAYLIVDVAEATGATKTLDVGTLATDADGFMDGVSCAATGFIPLVLTNAAATRGLLLRDDEDGAGAWAKGSFPIAAVPSVSTTAGSADWAEFTGRLVFMILGDPAVTR